MTDNDNDFLARRPARLCKMCGKCCRVVTSSVPHDELIERAKNGDKESQDFLELFEPFPSVENAMEVDKDIVLNIPDYKNKTFYTCRFLKGNLCSRYETRLDVCKRFPGSPWAVYPPGCGYEGWLFLEREKIMKHVRSLKEEQLKYKMMLKKETNTELRNKLNQLILSIDNYINMYEQYGSKNW